MKIQTFFSWNRFYLNQHVSAVLSKTLQRFKKTSKTRWKMREQEERCFKIRIVEAKTQISEAS